MKLINNGFYTDGLKILKSSKSDTKILNIQSGTQIIANSALSNSEIEQIFFPESLKEINSYAISNSGIKEIFINQEIIIHRKAFAYNCYLENININTKTVPIKCFLRCGKDTKNGFTCVLKNTEEIYAYAFAESFVNDLFFPNTLKIIDSCAFEYSTFKNTILFIPNGVQIIGPAAFYNTNLKDIYLPDSLEEGYDLIDETNKDITLHMSQKLFDKLKPGAENIEIEDNLDSIIKNMSIDKLENLHLSFKELNNYNLNKFLK